MMWGFGEGRQLRVVPPNGPEQDKDPSVIRAYKDHSSRERTDAASREDTLLGVRVL